MNRILIVSSPPRPSRAALALIAAALCLVVPRLAMGSTHTHHHDSDGTVARSGQWMIDRGDTQDEVALTFNAGTRGWNMNWSSSDIPIRSLAGLDPSAGASGQAAVEFRLKRDAGTFVCRGVIEKEKGAGVFHLELNPDYPAALEQRGVGRPDEETQARLAYADAGFALLDELKRQRFTTPTLEEFLTMAEHGVNLEYVRGMAGLGYHLESIAALIRARDHGVDPDYIETMRDVGFKSLTFDQLVNARDHGVDAKYARTIRELAGTNLPLEKLIQLRDHGVDLRYVAAMREAGFRNASLEDFQTARDHGVDPRYVTAMADVGFRGLALDDLIRARDHGVDPAFVRRVNDREREKPSLDEIIRLKDRGY